ncbi:HEAT repeat domain-containing protein [Methanobacterium oryzae]|uniref:HEAT repeat domain-containing protein n=1 Tax=Methanobacterium oryzae TaxID=69540 RepID=UPI003D208394
MSFNEIKPDIEYMEKNRDVEGLINALKFRDCIVRKEAAMAFKKIHDSRALFPLVDALKYQKWHDNFVIMGSVREYAAEALGALKDAKAVYPLIEALYDKDEEVRWKAAWALGNIGDKRAVDPLINSLSDERWYVRRYAASSLGNIKDKRAVTYLIDSLNDKEWQVRMYAAEALGKIGDIRAVEPLVNILSDNDKDIRLKAINSLANMKRAAVKPLIEAFESEDWRIRARVAEALGNIKDKSAVDVLINALVGKNKDNNRFVRGRVAEALGKIGDERAIEPLIQMLDDSYLYTRTKAEEALERMNTTLVLTYDDGEITFNYPISWEIVSVNDRKKIVKGNSADGKIKFSINRKKDLSDITSREFADIIKNALVIRNNQIVFENEFKVEGINIYKVIGENKNSPLPTRVIIVTLKTENILYYLWFYGEYNGFKGSKNEIDLIIDSFNWYL